MSKLMKKGSRGDNVKALQANLKTLGYSIEADGIFGSETLEAVKNLQSMFGYTVDGLVGDGTNGLIDQQIGHGWNVTSEDAKAQALKAQGK